ncbi:MAG: S-adenosyl-l-methionine hydroxide adenosyltransferase family protein [Candidatus Sigynarchaeota archaeon]
MPQYIGLLTDFGTRAGYVASMKGVILSICSSCHIVDLSHEITPQNVMEAALFLENCSGYFPRGFIFLAVVDPGVGTNRKMLCLRTRSKGQVFIAPDNGLLDLVMNAQGVDLLVSLVNKRYWLDATSQTFHGRDIMSPVAAHVAAGVDIADLGPAMDPSSAAKLAMPPPSRVCEDGTITGAVLYLDMFGNVITNVREEQLKAISAKVGDVLDVTFQGLHDPEHTTITVPLKRTYADVGRMEFLCLVNSEGRFEIAVNQGSAGSKLGVFGGGHPIGVKRHASR